MLKVVIFISIVANGLVATKPPIDARIVGGTATNISKFPWQISLQYDGSHICGGSIITQTCILTAAHCVQDAPATNLQIRAGSSNWSKGGVVAHVQNVIVHKEFDMDTMINDVAVLRLSTPLTISATIKTIALATNASLKDKALVITGWGKQKSGAQSIPSILRTTEVLFVSKKNCSSSRYGYGPKILSTMICGAAPGRDTCQGDSGGPLVYKNTVVGITSWGYGCAQARYPGVYTNVAFMRSWIKSKCGFKKNG